MKTTRLEITGWSCGHCVRAVEGGAPDVEYDGAATGPERLVAALEEEEYGARVAGSV